MMQTRINTIVAAFLLFTVAISQAGIIHCDFSNAPETFSFTSSGWNIFESGNPFLSADGINESDGELEISLSATGLFTFFRHAKISLGNGFAFAQENDVVDLNTPFSMSTEPLVSAVGKGQTKTFHDNLALLLDADNGLSLYGWAEVSATATVADAGKSSSASISILRLAFNDIDNEPVVVGHSRETAIPEPAAAILVMGFGIALISARRIFRK